MARYFLYCNYLFVFDMKFYFKNYLSVGIAFVFLSLCLVFCLLQVLRSTGSTFIYALDDPYIHLTIARNLLLHGSYGINPGQYAAASSSPFWVVMLYILNLIFGVNTYYPLIINFILAFILLITADFYLRKLNLHWLPLTFILISILFTSYVTAMVFSGMEHLLQALVTILFLMTSIKVIFPEDNSGNKTTGNLIFLIMLSAMMTGIRYEGMFLVFPLFVLLIIFRKYIAAAAVAVAGAVPILISGFISVGHGWFFLPSTLLIKGDYFNASGIGQMIRAFTYNGYFQLSASPALVVIAAVCTGSVIYFYNKDRSLKTKYTILNILYLSGMALHLQIASVGWSERYLIYLIFSGSIISVINLSVIYGAEKHNFKFLDNRISRVSALLVLIIILSPALQHGMKSLNTIKTVCVNIYEQQYQMSRFLTQYYKGMSIAVCDIGLTGYSSQTNIIDIYGLANLEAATAKYKKCYDTQKISNILINNNVPIAVIYDIRFGGAESMPGYWIKCAEWKIDNNIVCYDDRVSFYAKDSITALELKHNLILFSDELPGTVKKIYYF